MSDGLFLAGRFRRLVATLIDAILVPSLTLVLVMMAGVVEDAEDYADIGLMIVWVLLLAVASYMLLNGYGLWRRGQTLGKQVMGVAIVPSTAAGDGQYGRAPAPLWKLICVRALFFPLLFLTVVPWIAALPIIDQLMIFRKNRRCLHDLVCGTVVVRLGRRR
jgi:uncharacterized RDD family membrane protein YckC